MARQRSSQDAYTGRAGQMAVQGELLLRGCNVAVPEIDEGEDIIAFLRNQPVVGHLQVKTANAELLKEEGRYAGRVSVPLDQLHAPAEVELYYVFAVRLGNRWVDFIIINRQDLAELARVRRVGYENRRSDELQLYLSFGPQSVICSSHDLQPYRNAWDRLPPLAPSAPPAPLEGASPGPA